MAKQQKDTKNTTSTAAASSGSEPVESTSGTEETNGGSDAAENQRIRAGGPSRVELHRTAASISQLQEAYDAHEREKQRVASGDSRRLPRPTASPAEPS